MREDEAAPFKPEVQLSYVSKPKEKKNTLYRERELTFSLVAQEKRIAIK